MCNFTSRSPAIADTSLTNSIAAGMLGATSFDDRWTVINRTLNDLGATAVNAAALNCRSGLPFWFRSTLSEKILRAYEEQGHDVNDTIVRHAIRSTTPNVWRPHKRVESCETTEELVFRSFVVDTGQRSIVCISAPFGPYRDVKAITFCSTLGPEEVLVSGNLERVKLAIQLMLPWVDWPGAANGPDFISPMRATLTKRETDALRLLAGGMMNARIAEVMGISEVTVAKHLRAARAKLGANTREQALTLALRQGMIEM